MIACRSTSLIHCLTVGRKRLWQQFNNEDNLLFRESDFRSPETSEVFRTLWGLPDANCRALVGHLALACRKPLEEAPLLTELIDNGNVLPLSRQEETAVKDMLAAEDLPRKPPVRAVTDAADPGKGSPWWVSESAEPGDALAGTGSTFASDDDPELVGEAVPFGLKTMESLLAESPIISCTF